MPIVHKFCKIYISDKWSPALQIRTVLLSIQALLSAPNPDDPLANDVAELWKVIFIFQTNFLKKYNKKGVSFKPSGNLHLCSIRWIGEILNTNNQNNIVIFWDFSIKIK